MLVISERSVIHLVDLLTESTNIIAGGFIFPVAVLGIGP